MAQAQVVKVDQVSPSKRTLQHHLYTLWLFNRSDIKTILLPQTVFGVAVALSSGLLTTNNTPKFATIAYRLPKLIIWLWINLLNERVANQRLPSSIIEDAINKPWRPLPSKRITPDESNVLLLWVLTVIFFTSLTFGGNQASLALIMFSYMYNDLDGANRNWMVKNILNACGISCFSIGAAIVTIGYGSYQLREDAYTWMAILWLVIATTIQMQDLPDIEGDRERGRKTAPLVHGDAFTRCSIAAPVLIWSMLCPYYWGLQAWGYLLVVSVGGTVAGRVAILRGTAADAMTWKLWCLWMITLYSLPLMKQVG